MAILTAREMKYEVWLRHDVKLWQPELPRILQEFQYTLMSGFNIHTFLYFYYLVSYFTNN